MRLVWGFGAFLGFRVQGVVIEGMDSGGFGLLGLVGGRWTWDLVSHGVWGLEFRVRITVVGVFDVVYLL